jgi:hypothetical protein
MVLELKWALCTRRAAKSYSDGLALVKAALQAMGAGEQGPMNEAEL